MMTLGRRLMNLSHRGRWILFSSLVDIKDPGMKLLKAGKPENSAENAPFENDFFRSAKRQDITAKQDHAK